METCGDFFKPKKNGHISGGGELFVGGENHPNKNNNRTPEKDTLISLIRTLKIFVNGHFWPISIPVPTWAISIRTPDEAR